MSTERTAIRLSASQQLTPDDSPSRYLNTLPDDVLRLVLRYLSRRPQQENWHPYISGLLVITAVDVGGAFAHAASSEFNSIGGDGGIRLGSSADDLMFRPLFYRLPLLRIDLQLLEDNVLPDILRGCGAELRVLVLDPPSAGITKTDILAISTHCRRLSSLAIRCSNFEAPLTPIWRSLGSTLTRIYFGFYYATSDSEILRTVSLPDLTEHCVNLRRVDVLTMNHALAVVLVALGSRIRILGVEDELGKSIASWRAVFMVCTNLEGVHLKLRKPAKAVRTLDLVRAKLVSLTMHAPIPAAPLFFSVLSSHSVLKEFEFNVRKRMPDTLLHELFKSLKSVTTVTCNMALSNVTPCKDVINVIAHNLKNLQSFHIAANTSFKGEDVSALVNLPHLKSVTLRCPFAMNSLFLPPVEGAVEVMKKLRNCAHLVQLAIDDTNRWDRSLLIAEAAVTYGRKDFDMFIGGVQYRTW